MFIFQNLPQQILCCFIRYVNVLSRLLNQNTCNSVGYHACTLEAIFLKWIRSIEDNMQLNLHTTPPKHSNLQHPRANSTHKEHQLARMLVFI